MTRNQGKRRFYQSLILLSTGTLMLAYQNCSPAKFMSRQEESSRQENGDNGTGYGGILNQASTARQTFEEASEADVAESLLSSDANARSAMTTKMFSFTCTSISGATKTFSARLPYYAGGFNMPVYGAVLATTLAPSGNSIWSVHVDTNRANARVLSAANCISDYSIRQGHPVGFKNDWRCQNINAQLSNSPAAPHNAYTIGGGANLNCRVN